MRIFQGDNSILLQHEYNLLSFVSLQKKAGYIRVRYEFLYLKKNDIVTFLFEFVIKTQKYF